MTLREVYQLGKKQAQSGEIGAYCTDFDVLCLFEHCFGRDRQALIVHGAERASRPQMETFFSLLKKKAAGEPLQYLLGRAFLFHGRTRSPWCWRRFSG